MGATNLPDGIDHAFLRPGRFDRHIGIPPPDYEGRKDSFENCFLDERPAIGKTGRLVRSDNELPVIDHGPHPFPIVRRQHHLLDFSSHDKATLLELRSQFLDNGRVLPNDRACALVLLNKNPADFARDVRQ